MKLFLSYIRRFVLFSGTLLITVLTAHAATWVVTKAADTNDGLCDADCSLREAVANGSPGDIIEFSTLFSTPQSIRLQLGVIRIEDTLTINGPGVHLLTIDGGNSTSIFWVLGQGVTGTIRDLTVANGRGQNGGGIRNQDASLVLATVNISKNRDESGNGGGVYARGATSMINCTVSGNIGHTFGGGIHNEGGMMTITSSAIYNNSSERGGGGIYNGGGLRLFNSTITNNNSSGDFPLSPSGGGIFNGGELLVVNSTISHNYTYRNGGGISNLSSATIRNSIIAKNSAVSPNVDVDGSFSAFSSLGNNLIGNPTGGAGFVNGTNGDMVGTSAAPIDPLLGPLRGYGGGSFTRILLPGSPAIDQGDDCVIQPPANGGCLTNELLFDQRGSGFPRLFGGSVDIGAFERQGNDVSGTLAAFDYDADGRTDLSVYRPVQGAWYLQRSTAGFSGMQFGITTDKIVPADYDGDGKTDIAVYRPSAGQWYVVNSGTGTVSYPLFGVAEDLPVPGDYDGDGKADISVFRPSQGTWYRTNSSNGTTFGMQFGQNGDVPTVGDFDGDGKNDLGIFRPSVGDWYNIRSSNGSVFGERFGQTGDRIAPADYDGDGKTDIAIYRPSTGLWVIRNSATATYSYEVFGLPADIPISGDYDGDGKADIGVWRPSDGTWYIKRSDNSQFIVFPWGQTGDKPTPSAYGN